VGVLFLAVRRADGQTDDFGINNLGVIDGLDLARRSIEQMNLSTGLSENETNNSLAPL
jgi:hypothetical protein